MSPSPTENNLLTAALDLVGRGCHVFPLKPSTKVPAVNRDWEHRASADPDRVERCWRACPFNIGVACGPSGLYVLDLDTPKPDTKPPEPPFNQSGVNDGADALAVLATHYAELFPFDTFTVETGRGGMHLYFRQPEGAALRNTAGKLGWLIDTRGVGGYVVGPGSIVDGNPYRVTIQSEIAPLPAWIRRLLTPRPRPVAPAGPTPRLRSSSGYAAAVLRGELGKLAAAKPGTRNNTLNQVAFTLGRHVARGTLPYALAEVELIAAADRLGGDTAKSHNTIRRALQDGRQKGGTP